MVKQKAPWETDNPKPKKKRKKMTEGQVARARRRAADAGRPYPNLIDNMAVVAKKVVKKQRRA
jgi:hypothetical protein